MPNGDGDTLRGHQSISLEKYIDTRFEEICRYIDRRFEDSRLAIDKAEHSMNMRLEGMNEFRDQLRDQAARFITREELASQLRPINEVLKVVETAKDLSAGKASWSQVRWAQVLGVIGILIGVISLALRVFANV